MLEDQNGRGRAVSGQTLGTLLYDHKSMRLVVLNACEGARASRADPFAGAAQSLIQQGVPAVIAMQFEISDDAAILFAHEFYDSLARAYPVDAALGEARRAIGLDELETLKERLAVVHLHDNDGARDMHWLPFTGTVDWDRLARLMADSGYAKCVSMESNMHAHQDIRDERTFLARAFEAGGRLSEMIGEARRRSTRAGASCAEQP